MPERAREGDGRSGPVQNIKMHARGTVTQQFADLVVSPRHADRFRGARIVIDDLQLLDQRIGQGTSAHRPETLDLREGERGE